MAFILFLCLLWSCQKSPYKGYSISDTGLNYKLEVLGDGERTALKNDYLTIAYRIESDSGNLVKKSRILFKLRNQNQGSPVLEAISMLRKGDSLSVILDKTIFYKEFVQDSPSHLLNNQKLIKVGLKLEELQSEKEFQKSKKEFINWLINNNVDDVDFIREQNMIKEIIKQDNYQYSVTPTGLFYTELKEGKGDLVDFGDGVIIHFEGYTQDGKKFDSTYERKAWFDFIIGQEDQVIKGIEEGLFLMNEGSVYRFIIPSYLAFKENGTINGMVKPNEPVIYEVKLVKKSE